MQPPTCRGIRVRSPSDAERIFHGVYTKCLRMVDRRLDTEERRAIHSGCVYVWEERGSNADAVGLGIERWTDSISWGPSRVRDEFLFYHERRPAQAEPLDPSNPGTIRRTSYRPSLVKQTYSVFVNTHYGRRKWHLIAYFTQETVDQLGTVDDIPALAGLVVPKGIYTCARNNNRPARNRQHPDSSKYRRSGSSSSSSTLDIPRAPPRRNPDATLAPLEYLEAVAPRPRHAVDESAIMSFSGIIEPYEFAPRYLNHPTPQTPRRYTRRDMSISDVEARFRGASHIHVNW